MGLSIEDVPYIGFAERWGAGSTEIRPGDIITLNEPEAGKGYPPPSSIVKHLTRRVREEGACSACYAALVRGLYIAQKEGISLNRDIAIGQGWRGKRFSGLGIGNCCAMAGEHVRGCPPTAVEVTQFLRTHGK